MNIKHHPNPITSSNRLGNDNRPQGVGRHKSRAAFAKPKGISGRTQTYKGIRLVKWLLENDMKVEARQVLADIKAGKINPRTGESNG